MTVRSPSQLAGTARQLLRNAYSQGCTDDEAIDFAAAAMGQDYKPLIGSIQAREFKNYMGAG